MQTLKLVRRPGKFVSNQALHTMFSRYELSWDVVKTPIQTDLVVVVMGCQENIDALVATTLWETQPDEPKKELYFDSYGFLHGQAGYLRACKDPENWEIHYYGGFWLPMPGVGIEHIKENTEFRRKIGRPITHEELNSW